MRWLTLKVSDIMTSRVKTVSPDYSVSKTISIMEKHGVKEVPVIDGKKFMGIIDMNSIIKSVKASPEMKVKSKIVNYPIVGPESGVEECITLMVSSGIEFLPVVEKGKLIGVISDYDILKQKRINGVVSEVVRSKVPSCSTDDTVGTAMKFMRSSGVDRLAVVEEGVCIGMVLLIDILRKTHIEHKKGGVRDLGGEMKKTMAFPVLGIMRDIKNKVYPDTDLSSALSTMLDQNLRGVPVTNMENRPVGILLRKDILSRMITPSKKGLTVRVSGRGDFDRDEVIATVESQLKKGHHYKRLREIKVHVKQIHSSEGSEGKYEISMRFIGDKPMQMERTGFIIGDVISDMMDDAERVMDESSEKKSDLFRN
jgi:CBS domain-containing protein